MESLNAEIERLRNENQELRSRLGQAEAVLERQARDTPRVRKVAETQTTPEALEAAEFPRKVGSPTTAEEPGSFLG